MVQTTPEGLGWSPVLDGEVLIQAVPSSFSLLLPPSSAADFGGKS